jgi:hypothetical protein
MKKSSLGGSNGFAAVRLSETSSRLPHAASDNLTHGRLTAGFPFGSPAVSLRGKESPEAEMAFGLRASPLSEQVHDPLGQALFA